MIINIIKIQDRSSSVDNIMELLPKYFVFTSHYWQLIRASQYNLLT